MLSTNPKIDAVIPVPSLEIMFWQRDLHKYVHITCEPKAQSLNLALQAHVLEWRLTGFRKVVFVLCITDL